MRESKKAAQYLEIDLISGSQGSSRLRNMIRLRFQTG
jgi:hypothetical protein